MAILAFNCGSFASSMSPNEEICGLFRRFKAGFSLWLESFYRGAFVDIIRHSPLLAGTSFSVFHRVCEQHTDWFYHPVSAAPYGFLSKVGSDRNLKFIKQVLCCFRSVTISTEIKVVGNVEAITPDSLQVVVN